MPLSIGTENLIGSAAALGGAVMARVDRAQYGRVLTNLYEVVRRSVPFMQTAHCLTTDVRLGDYLEQHIKEEAGHDRWLLEDMAALGDQLVSPTPDKHLESAMVAHEQLLASGDVWPLVGHMWVLESRPPSSTLLQGLRERLGLTAEMTRTMDRHADVDPQHASEIDALLSGFDSTVVGRVELGARITATGVIRMWLAIDASMSCESYLP